MDLTPLGTSRDWDHTVFVLLCLAPSLSTMSLRSSHREVFFLPSSGCLLCQCVDRSHSVRPSIHRWVPGCFRLAWLSQWCCQWCFQCLAGDMGLHSLLCRGLWTSSEGGLLGDLLWGDRFSLSYLCLLPPGSDLPEATWVRSDPLHTPRGKGVGISSEDPAHQ